MNSRNGARALMSRSPSLAVLVTFSSIRSHLFTAMMTPAPRSQASLAIFRSWTCMPSFASTTNRQTSARSIARVAAALANGRGHWERLAQSQLVERELTRLVRQVVGLVYDQ